MPPSPLPKHRDTVGTLTDIDKKSGSGIKPLIRKARELLIVVFIAQEDRMKIQFEI
jgi:hypothetical protein